MITIDGTEYSPVARTLRIKDNINAKSICTMSVDTENDFTVGEEVIVDLSTTFLENDTVLDDSVFLGGTKIFGGTIDSYILSYLRGGTTGKRKRYQLTCIDYNQTTNRKRVAETYENETVGAIVTDLHNKYLSDEGITLGTIALSTTVVSKAVFNYVTLSDAFDYIRIAIPSLNWNIDYDKELTFFQRADNTGEDFTDANCYEMTLQESRKDYANAVYVRAGDSTTEVQVDESPSPKPDGVSKVFSVRFPIATKPDIEINSTPVLGSDIGILGLDTGKKWYWQKDSKDIVQDDLETTLSTSDTITVSYQGLKPILVLANNPAEQASRATVEGGTGVYEIIENKRSLDDKSAALEYANGLVEQRGEIPRTINISSPTYRQSGQLINVKSDNLDVNEDFLISQVDIFDINGCDLRYTVKGLSGADLGTWVEFFRSLKETDDIAIKENEILIKLLNLTEPLNANGTYTIVVSNPLYPSNTLFPSETLYPNTSIIQEVVVND